MLVGLPEEFNPHTKSGSSETEGFANWHIPFFFLIWDNFS